MAENKEAWTDSVVIRMESTIKDKDKQIHELFAELNSQSREKDREILSVKAEYEEEIAYKNAQLEIKEKLLHNKDVIMTARNREIVALNEEIASLREEIARQSAVILKYREKKKYGDEGNGLPPCWEKFEENV